MAIGFKYVSSTISKWEKSLFGGFHRLISDHPRVIVNYKVDFDFAKHEQLAYFEKEKLVKIFLSKANSNGLIEMLMDGAITTKEKSFLYKEVLKTTINKTSKNRVIDALIYNNKEKEYSPLFEHYKEFIDGTEIYFEQPDKNESDDGEKNEDGEENDDKNDGNKDGVNDDNSESNKDQDEKKDTEQSDNNSKPNSGSQKPISSSNGVEKNSSDFKNALEEIKIQEYVFNSLSTFDQKVKTISLQPNGSETQFCEDEILVADRLTKMLDISFDPTSDVVKNLRLGKLDITKIAEVPAGNIAIYKQNIEYQTTKPFSVAILCDQSFSMTQNGRLYSQYKTVKSLYKSFSDIIPQDKIFIYGHSGEISPELYIYHDHYNPNFLNTIDIMMSHECKENYDGPIIEEVHKNIRSMTNDRIILIVLSDGRPGGCDYGGDEDIVNMKQIIEKCKRDDFVTVGVGIQEHIVKDLYQYSAVVDDLSDMPKKVSHIINHVVKTEFQ